MMPAIVRRTATRTRSSCFPTTSSARTQRDRQASLPPPGSHLKSRRTRSPAASASIRLGQQLIRCSSCPPRQTARRRADDGHARVRRDGIDRLKAAARTSARVSEGGRDPSGVEAPKAARPRASRCRSWRSRRARRSGTKVQIQIMGREHPHRVLPAEEFERISTAPRDRASRPGPRVGPWP
jgi:hypothetical protein